MVRQLQNALEEEETTRWTVRSAARTDLLQDPLRDDKDEDSRLPGSLNQGTLKSSKISECLL